MQARVTKRAQTEDGVPIGHRNTNPLLDTREYECLLDDGVTERYTANQIAENIYSQCDAEGLTHLVLSEIIDHRSDGSAIPIADGYVQSRRRQPCTEKDNKRMALIVRMERWCK